jgi:di/tricarboxylate transporter
MELTSIGIVYFVLLVFHISPVIDRNGVARITTTRILHGFSNPVLIAVLALWAIGQGVVRTGVLGGMTTIIGSSKNLLVNSALIEMGETPFGFFDFTLPGTVMAAVGLVYVVFVAPKLLPDRSGEV